MIVYDTLDLTDLSDGKIVGKHATWLPVWIPPAPFSMGPLVGSTGIKIPFQNGGRIQKYRHPHEASYGLDSFARELILLRWLAARGYAPPVGQEVFFKTVISEHTGVRWADPLGAHGFEMQDATCLPMGPVTAEVLAQLRASGDVVGSDGAWHDLLVVERMNIVNGYVIDVRRSGFDMLRLRGDEDCRYAPWQDDPSSIRSRLYLEGSFPFKQRAEPYQEFYLHGLWEKGEREVVQRAKILGFDPKPGESVLDLGCCTGGFLQLAALAGAGPLVGLDAQPEFVNLARDLARANHMNICAFETDLHARHGTPGWIRHVFPNGVDHLLILSMGKHLGEPLLWWWVDTIGARKTYLETNACGGGDWPLQDEVLRHGGRYVGDTTDRNRRRTYLIERG